MGLVEWFLDPANWSGRDAIGVRLLEHVVLSGLAIAIGVAAALPVGLYIGHTGRTAFVAVSLSNIGRAVPSYAVLVILFGFFVSATRDTTVFTNGPTLLAMIALAIPPIVTNTFIGLREVDRELVEAARGIGMRGSQLLRQVELPLALPVIMAGIRIASVQVIATAALGAIIGGGGLGRYIVQGFLRHDDARLLAGALMVALLAVGADFALGSIQRRLTSPGLVVSAGPQPAAGGQPL
ncbi:MAG TPA: ABC transporter permease [Candidatus Limnocylindria bacterium]|nr:ABC transporter permease [Candidatus Limnocylindria bacterium]